jgi:hypothetical protein
MESISACPIRTSLIIAIRLPGAASFFPRKNFSAAHPFMSGVAHVQTENISPFLD